MRVATHTLWNTRIRWPERLEAAYEELPRPAADVVALQEVAAQVGERDARDAARYLADQCGYDYVATRLYANDPDEGPAFLSRLPLRTVEAGWDTGLPALESCGLRASVNVGGTEVAITNVHLDSGNIAIRETQISQLLEWIATRSTEGCYEVLCGDFNCPPDSSVYRFLMGQQTLLGRGITPWHDLARYSAERAGGVAAPTLDFWSNPRWRDAPTLEIPMRFDWILLQDVFGRALSSPSVTDAGVFGTELTPRARAVPSDHYGVYADIAFGG